MIQIKKTILTLVALLALTAQAWAEDTYTITFAANGNTKTVENVALPKTFQCSYDNADGELDLILKELYSWSGDKNKTFCDGETTPNSSDKNKVVAGNDNGDHYITINNVFEGTVTITGYYVVNSLVIETPYSLEISIAAADASADEVAWNKAEKTGTFKMPGGNVTLEPEYYPQAALTAEPTAINDVPATTDGAIVNAGTVKNIGETTNAQGTVMYYVSQTPMTDAQLLALAADKWTADVPTAESLAEGQAYVYYYVRGNDSDNDAENFSDGDILADNALTVTIAAEPTYAVTFADGVNPDPENPEWTATPNPAKTKQTVTVTYSGERKVMGVKAEKKASTEPTVTLTPGEIGDLTSSSKTINGITIEVSGDARFRTTGLMDVSAYDPDTFEPVPGAEGTFTFTSSVGKIKRIDINHNIGNWSGAGDGWPGSYEVSGDNNTFTWSGTPAASVTLNGSDNCRLVLVSSIVFTLEK